MRKFAALVTGLVIALASVPSFAAWSTNGVRIVSVEVQADTGMTIVEFASRPSNASTCMTGNRALLEGTPDNIKQMSAVATAAFLSGKLVRANFHGPGLCASGAAFIIGISMSTTP